ncbi:MAG: GNAT family N-acetyltransferase [Bacteroidales bacterium]|nr:GNAT family N-acetyltransferase [Bacteroidales bacterium]
MISTRTKFNYKIRLAEKDDTLSILRIWRECFTDDLLYISNFINYCLPYTKTWVVIPEESNYAVAILSLLPSYAIIENQKIIGSYIYGVATLPNFRGHSLSKRLIETAVSYCEENEKQYIVIRPAESSLFDLYKKQSFDTIISKNITKIDLNHINLTDISPLKRIENFSISVFYSIREEELFKTHLLWPMEILNYTIEDAKSKGGSLYALEGENSEKRTLFYIAYPEESNVDKIKMADSNIMHINELSQVILDIKLVFPFAKELIIESSSGGFKPDNTAPENSALIKILDNKIDSKKISLLHLALPME